MNTARKPHRESHIGAAALVQGERNGKALAQLLNWIGAGAKRSPEWLAAFDEELDERGLALIWTLAETATALIDPPRKEVTP